MLVLGLTVLLFAAYLYERLERILQDSSTTPAVHNASEALLVQVLVALPVVLLLAAAGGLFLASRALGPIDRVTRTAQAVSARDFTRRIGHTGPADEVGRLAATFDQMLDRLQAAFERERRFTADASHELRTPLASIKGRIGVALTQDRTVDEYRATLGELERDVDRLSRLTSSLLFLTRLDQGRLTRGREVVDLTELLAAVVDQMEPLAAERQIILRHDIGPALQVDGDPDHLISLFLNLLDNAVKYSPPGTHVGLTAASADSSVLVIVSDQGPGIPPEHLPRLFDRFYRVDPDRSRTSGGAGLGLAIAYEIAQLYGGSIDVYSRGGEGTVFTVRMPPDV